MYRSVYLGTELHEMPEYFKNLYKSMGRVAEYKFDTVNRFLESEPYNVRLVEAQISSYRNKDWFLEFNTHEDYMAFILKWS